MDKYIHVAIKDLLSNPFRRVEHYPIRREKVEALKESIEKTGFWDNLLVRPAGKGKYERAFGEHRAAALREHFNDSDYKVGVIVREISDEDMIRIMARENMEEWGKTSGIVEIETVHSVIIAYREGKINLPSPAKKTNPSDIRYASAFRAEKGLPNSHPFTAQTVAQFLGWLNVTEGGKEVAATRIHTILTALEFLTEGSLKESELAGLSSKQCEAVIVEARKKYRDRINIAKAAELEAAKAAKEVKEAEARKAAAKDAAEQEEARKAIASAERRQVVATEEAKSYRKRANEAVTKVGRGVSQALKSGTRGYREAADIADDIIHDRPKERELMQAEKFIGKLASNLYETLRPGFDPRTERLEAIIQANKDRSIEIEPRKIQNLTLTLVNLSKRALAYADQLAPTGNAVKFVSGLNENQMLEDVK